MLLQLILPFLLQGLYTVKVEECNTRNPVTLVVDPSPMMVEITIMLHDSITIMLSWRSLSCYHAEN